MKSDSDTRHLILRALKQHGSASLALLAEELGITREAVRQHLAQLEARGLVEGEVRATPGRGRPAAAWRLTRKAEDEFPKFYDALTVTLIHALDEKYGSDGVRDVLAAITDRQVAAWQPALEGKPLSKRIEALRGIYFDKDPFTQIAHDDEGAMLIEHNCPFLSTALEEPRLCGVTLSTLKRLLGVEVERTERFQNGDGRCVFRIHAERKVAKRFCFAWDTPDEGV